MLADARPGHPLEFFIECGVVGRLDEGRFRAAVAAAATRHPLLRSRVGRVRSGPVWLPPDRRPEVEWHPGPTDRDPWRAIDITRESGCRVVVLAAPSAGSTPGGHRVVLVVQHACCDGIAALEYLGDIWAAYAGLDPPSLTTADRPAAAVTAPASAPADPLAPSVAPAAPWRQALAFASFRPTPLARDTTTAAAAAPAAATLPPYETIAFDRDEAERLRAASVAMDASLNDLLVAAAMRSITRWNEHTRGRGGNIRITMPVSLRPPRQRLPACNAISYAFIDRSAAAVRDPRALVASIKEATRYILDTGAARGFLDAVTGLSGLRGGLELVTRLPLCLSTAVVSNVGDASRRMRSGVPRSDGRDMPGDVVIDSVSGVPPLRPGTRLALGIVLYAGGFTISCLCSAHADPRIGARRFLAILREELDDLARAADAG